MLVSRRISPSIHSWASSRARRRVVEPPLVPQVDGEADVALPPSLLAHGADRDPLVHQRGERHPPPLAGLAEALAVGDADVGEVHLVELGVARHLPQRPDLDAGGVHVDDEVGQALVLGNVGVGAGEQQAPAGHVGECRPDLLAVDHPLVAVAHRPGRQRGEIRARTGLAEHLAPDLLAAERRAQVPVADLVGPVGDDRRPRHPDAHHVDEQVVGCPGLPEPLVDLLLHQGVQAEPTAALGELHPGETAVELGGPELRRRRRLRIEPVPAARRVGSRRGRR